MIMFQEFVFDGEFTAEIKKTLLLFAQSLVTSHAAKSPQDRFLEASSLLQEKTKPSVKKNKKPEAAEIKVILLQLVISKAGAVTLLS